MKKKNGLLQISPNWGKYFCWTFIGLILWSRYLQDQTEEVDPPGVVAVEALADPWVALQLPLYTFTVIARS